MNMLEGQILYHQLQAQYWMALATTGLAKRRDYCRGDGTPLTDEEKTQDAMDIANNHMHIVQSMVEKLGEEKA